mmetsp:Transcript_113220/g.351466  ORF Transcript_113220/g.351466 Transcript_113220/m.351466 type:complete len:373 (+) Transcript_113220:277-1395(+)
MVGDAARKRRRPSMGQSERRAAPRRKLPPSAAQVSRVPRPLPAEAQSAQCTGALFAAEARSSIDSPAAPSRRRERPLLCLASESAFGLAPAATRSSMDSPAAARRCRARPSFGVTAGSSFERAPTATRSSIDSPAATERCRLRPPVSSSSAASSPSKADHAAGPASACGHWRPGTVSASWGPRLLPPSESPTPNSAGAGSRSRPTAPCRTRSERLRPSSSKRTHSSSDHSPPRAAHRTIASLYCTVRAWSPAIGSSSNTSFETQRGKYCAEVWSGRPCLGSQFPRATSSPTTNSLSPGPVSHEALNRTMQKRAHGRQSLGLLSVPRVAAPWLASAVPASPLLSALPAPTSWPGLGSEEEPSGEAGRWSGIPD